MKHRAISTLVLVLGALSSLAPKEIEAQVYRAPGNTTAVTPHGLAKLLEVSGHDDTFLECPPYVEYEEDCSVPLGHEGDPVAVVEVWDSVEVSPEQYAATMNLYPKDPVIGGLDYSMQPGAEFFEVKQCPPCNKAFVYITTWIILVHQMTPNWIEALEAWLGLGVAAAIIVIAFLPVGS